MAAEADAAGSATTAGEADAGTIATRPAEEDVKTVAAAVDAGPTAEADTEEEVDVEDTVAPELDTVLAVDTEPVSPGSERRAELDAALTTMGYSLPPEACRSSDAAVEGAFIDAIKLLDGGRAGGARDEDARSLALLEAVEDRARKVAEYWVLVAQARLYAGQQPSAVLDAAVRAETLCTSWAAAHNAVGNAHMRLNENEEAVASYKKAAEIDPAYAAPRFNIGLIKLKQNDQEGAIQAFTEVIGRSPDHPNARLLRGQAYLRLKQWERAIADFKAETDRDSTNPRAWLLLGQAAQQSGDDAAGQVAFCKAKELGAEEAKALCTE
ncbi:MAG: tetratricopeptide repeat protein [Deltaproteobacteria bacterium]|nr:MAG: tetratricopeptide repeat protein [Deltaproteobacteria bacterium]